MLECRRVPSGLPLDLLFDRRPRTCVFAYYDESFPVPLSLDLICSGHLSDVSASFSGDSCCDRKQSGSTYPFRLRPFSFLSPADMTEEQDILVSACFSRIGKSIFPTYLLKLSTLCGPRSRGHLRALKTRASLGPSSVLCALFAFALFPRLQSSFLGSSSVT